METFSTEVENKIPTPGTHTGKPQYNGNKKIFFIAIRKTSGHTSHQTFEIITGTNTVSL